MLWEREKSEGCCGEGRSEGCCGEGRSEGCCGEGRSEGCCGEGRRVRGAVGRKNIECSGEGRSERMEAIGEVCMINKLAVTPVSGSAPML